MKVTLKHKDQIIDTIEIPDQAPHPTIITKGNFAFFVSQDCNEYSTQPHYDANRGYLFEATSEIVAMNKKLPEVLKD